MDIKRKLLSPMGRFALRYFFWAPTLFLLLYFDRYSPFVFVNRLQTDLSIFLVQHWISDPVMRVTMRGADLFFDHGLHLTIVNECNGMAAFLLFFAAVLAYPASLTLKVVYSLVGYIILTVANTARLVGITLYVADHPDSFLLLHEVVGRYAIAVLPLILFFYFTNHSTPSATK